MSHVSPRKPNIKILMKTSFFVVVVAAINSFFLKWKSKIKQVHLPDLACKTSLPTVLS